MGSYLLALVAGLVYGVSRSSTLHQGAEVTRDTAQQDDESRVAAAGPTPTSTTDAETATTEATATPASDDLEAPPVKSDSEAKTHKAPSRDKRWPFEAHCPRYAADGIGIYYAMEYHIGEDGLWGFEVLYRQTIGSPPVVVSADATGVPAEVRDTWSRSLLGQRQTSASLRMAACGPRRTGGEATPLWWSTRRPGSARTAATFDSGQLWHAVWLDDNTVLAGLSLCEDGSCRLELVDIPTGQTTTVFRVAQTRRDMPVSIDRMLFDPEGFALFSAGVDLTAEPTLYRYDVEERVTKRLCDVAWLGHWDYSPSRNMLVQVRGKTPTESPLPK